MIKYICKRLIYLALTLWVIVTATFFSDEKAARISF